MGKRLTSSPARDFRRVSLSPSHVGDRRIRRLKKLRAVRFTAEIGVDEDDRSSESNIAVVSFAGIDGSAAAERGGELGLGGVGSGPGYGIVSVIGRRREMEDAARAEPGFAPAAGGGGGRRRLDFFGVYDGHGGGIVASACRERLHEVLAAEIVRTGDFGGGGIECWERVMEGCFGKMTEEVGRNAAARTAGATAVAAVVAEDEVVVANCGDCRAVLCRDGLALPLSVDHKPDRPDELERIEAASGRVINWNGHRVLGVLATSRSIGDPHLRPFVISKPEVTVTKRTNKDEFLILASDGLWDVVSNEVACKVVKKCLGGKINNKKIGKEIPGVCKNRASEAAAVLAELAMAWGSRDNISVIVVDLRNS